MDAFKSRPAVLTVQELAHYLRVHRSTVYRLLRQGQVPAFKIGSDWRFSVQEIDRWQAEMMSPLSSSADQTH